MSEQNSEQIYSNLLSNLINQQIIDGTNNVCDEEEDDDAIYNINLCNTYLKYYKMTYPEESVTTMFHGINAYKLVDTNKIMELFLNDMKEYEAEYEKDIEKCQIYIPKKFKKSTETLYGLQVDEELKYVSEMVFPLLICVTDNYLLSNWVIINLK
jgi:hypothetical protein